MTVTADRYAVLRNPSRKGPRNRRSLALLGMTKERSADHGEQLLEGA
jgi:hypothetical protein